MKQAFLSYAHLDKTKARRLYSDLNASPAIRIWFDENDLLPGMKLTPATRKAIRESRYFIALMSKKSVSRRGFRHTELRRALEILDEFPDDKIYLIPARIDKCKPLDDRMRGIICADLFPVWNTGVDRIKKSLGIPQKPVSKGAVSAQRPKKQLTKTGRRKRGTRRRPSDYHYRVCLATLDTHIPELRSVAHNMNAIQLFFWFQTFSVKPSSRALRRIDGFPQLDVDKLSSTFYKRIGPLNVDYVFCVTDRFLTYMHAGRPHYNYLGFGSDVDKRVMFTSIGGLEEYADEAGVTMEVALAYTLVSQIVSHFLDVEYHDEIRGCPMDWTGDHADMVKGLKKGRFCRSCSPRIRKNKKLERAIKAMLNWGR